MDTPVVSIALVFAQVMTEYGSMTTLVSFRLPLITINYIRYSFISPIHGRKTCLHEHAGAWGRLHATMHYPSTWQARFYMEHNHNMESLQMLDTYTELKHG